MNEVTHYVFHSMGIPVHITLVGVTEKEGKKNVAQVEKIFQDYDARFSRFKETSELHKLNTSKGAWHTVSLPMFEVLKKTVALAEETDGLFDPSVGGILASYGYGLPEKFVLPTPLPTYRDIEFNERELSIRLVPNQVLEPASIVKGMAIDDGGRILIECGVPGFLINAGGDIITHGTYENSDVWNVAVQDPLNSNSIVTAVALRNQGMATSGTYQTKGSQKGTEWHHLINMQTGKPSEGVVSATVIADTCEVADTEASLAILLPQVKAIERLQKRGLPFFLISHDGTVTKNEMWAALEIAIPALLS